MVTLLHTLQSQRSDQSGTYTRAVLGSQNLNWVVALAKWLAITTLLPVENLLQSLRAAGLRYH